MKVVVLQPSYIPWRGFFDQIRKADVFVFYDCVQYDHGGWRNRNQIKTPNGRQWLTIPVQNSGAHTLATPIREIRIAWNSAWNRKHLSALRQNYGRAPYFADYVPLLEEFYGRQDECLADFTCHTTVALARALGINRTQFIRSSTLPAAGARNDRLLSILQHLGATHYVSGPSARDYLDLDRFAAAGISVEFMAYEYPEYPQLHGPFEPQVTILDLLFNTGPEAATHLAGPQ